MSRWDFRPHGSTVVDEAAFACVTELETRHAARLRYTVSMLTVYSAPAMPVVNPADAAEQLAAAVSPLIRDTDLVEIVPPAAAVRVLLVGGELKDLRTVIQRIRLGIEKFVITYPHTGNIAAASIPVALEQGKFRDGDWLVMPTVGAGMAWGAVTYRWYDYKGRGSPEALR